VGKNPLNNLLFPGRDGKIEIRLEKSCSSAVLLGENSLAPGLVQPGNKFFDPIPMAVIGIINAAMKKTGGQAMILPPTASRSS
jgi:hypothetical protein